MSNSEINKTQYFEYFLSKLYNYLGQEDSNDLSIVKTQKLLYFLSNSIKEEDNYPLFETFDNFYALPYGHVESDIYKAIKGEDEYKLSYYKVTRFGTKRINTEIISINDKFTLMIDKGFINLLKLNIISRNASYLVDLSHCHDSWIKNYRQALVENRNSKRISIEDLNKEQKYFAL